MSGFSLHDLVKIIDARAASGGEGSYTRKLLDKGPEHCAKKFGEEAVETVIAGVGPRSRPSHRGERGFAVSLACLVEVARRQA